MRTFPFPTLIRHLSIIIVLSTFSSIGCKKIDSKEFTNPVEEKHIEAENNFNARSASEIRDWLDNKKTEIGIDSNATIDKILESMDDAQLYTESFRKEQFIIIPIDDTANISRNIRTDLNAPFKFLLLVEDENGDLRKGNIALFYPSSAIIANLPQGFFTDFFEKESVAVDGTFALLSLDDVKQYEMDFENGSQKEFRLWEGRLQPAAPSEPVCYDHYVITTVYYSDGTTQTFEDYLYTQCYGIGGTGGGSGSNPPNTNNQQIRQADVSFLVRRMDSPQEGWSMYAFYRLTGIDFPNNPSSNYFTSVPLNTTGTTTSTSAMVFGPGMPGIMQGQSYHPYYVIYSLGNNTTGLIENNKRAWANFMGCLTYPNLSPVDFRCYNKSQNWPAALILH